MFATQMTESIKNVVEIVDFDEETVRGMLEYIYTGQTETIEQNKMNLLEISTKYQLLGLKAKCEDVIMANLNVENAGEVLSLADLCSPNSLKPQVMSFINK